jgi:hypothetical protein
VSAIQTPLDQRVSSAAQAIVTTTVVETAFRNGTGAVVTITRTITNTATPLTSIIPITLYNTQTINGTATVVTITTAVSVTNVPSSGAGSVQGNTASATAAPTYIWVATGLATLVGMFLPLLTLA